MSRWHITGAKVMIQLDYKFNDGGRSKYYTAKNVGDCATRAIAIASGCDYKEVYNRLRQVLGYSPRNGIKTVKDMHTAVELFGGQWHSTMTIGSGCRVHLCQGEIPMTGRLVCRCSRHLVAVLDGVINDTYEPDRYGERCVYGYWVF